MPSVYGARLTTFEDSEKESEYGYVRKSVSDTTNLLGKLFVWKEILQQSKCMKKQLG
ncbi:hypothetical protein CsSME_00053045 [Camellia sinensis var. sinensis]